jgi:hypothetical protein
MELKKPSVSDLTKILDKPALLKWVNDLLKSNKKKSKRNKQRQQQCNEII